MTYPYHPRALDSQAIFPVPVTKIYPSAKDRPSDLLCTGTLGPQNVTIIIQRPLYSLPPAPYMGDTKQSDCRSAYIKNTSKCPITAVGGNWELYRISDCSGSWLWKVLVSPSYLPFPMGSRTQHSDSVVLLLTLRSSAVTYPTLSQQVRLCGQGLGWRPDFLPTAWQLSCLLLCLERFLQLRVVPVEWGQGIFPDGTIEK